ncbi:hypothetical protein [Nonomuraea sp. NEAU-A123]|uniref:hypothetical protein n=1 Tax=Nonomuraea sp. NEAU-A123 TaxID=2839649 RepID=UPI001BE4BA5E|nr:hypothetical protein [Nonomuraea sp. NEAU-A123]MBT2232290.1 hypothetical protein [Nonomuraea sp. NEAU-A123]
MTDSSEGSRNRKRSLLIPTGDIRDIVELGTQLQHEASEYNIHNVFDDGGYKELLLLKMFGLHKLNRTGDDAADDDGNQYEIKTVARVSSSGKRKTSLSVTTEHTLTLENLRRYRSVRLWIVAVFNQSHPEAIYEVTPQALERYFMDWEQKLITQAENQVNGGAPSHLNNPKIPLNFIKQNGVRVWPEGELPMPDYVQQGLYETEELP